MPKNDDRFSIINKNNRNKLYLWFNSFITKTQLITWNDSSV